MIVSAGTEEFFGDALTATPTNLVSIELASINDLVSMIKQIGVGRAWRHYDLAAPRGVAGRSSDNTLNKRCTIPPSLSEVLGEVTAM